MRLIYEGKAKRVYDLGNGLLLMEFKDEVTAFDGARRDFAPGKGRLAAAQSAFLFRILEDNGLRTHFIDWDGDRRIRVVGLRMLPIEVIVRNYAYGSFLRRMPMVKELHRFKRPLVEFHLKDDRLHDPLILPEDLVEAGLLSEDLLMELRKVALRVNDVLGSLLEGRGAQLIDFKLEFGFDGEGKLRIADELSGDTMRVLFHGKHLDKEIYRKGGEVAELIKSYKELNEVLGIKVNA